MAVARAFASSVSALSRLALSRGTSGQDYMALQEALERIRGTVIATNISNGR
ncbi:MAG: replication initiator protein A [Chitinophagales bacterium]|nr:replication initiator protein A [Hyphomicrobiales bacterium]